MRFIFTCTTDLRHDLDLDFVKVKTCGRRKNPADGFSRGWKLRTHFCYLSFGLVPLKQKLTEKSFKYAL